MSKKRRRSPHIFPVAPVGYVYVYPYPYPFTYGGASTESNPPYPTMFLPPSPQMLWNVNISSYPMMWNQPTTHSQGMIPYPLSHNISPKQSSYQKKESEWVKQWDSPQSPQSPWIRAYENKPEEM